ncbi:hypothetical protein RRG08_061876 [Elysia crispata]|uniref:Uncharacterized protein n=1 Tax=Elysia crispata TaxID=231223 RepID=A0AAE0XM22_9GAST|nr:hypothetical protein RRG08_061876 [Elysia crispata]
MTNILLPSSGLGRRKVVGRVEGKGARRISQLLCTVLHNQLVSACRSDQMLYSHSVKVICAIFAADCLVTLIIDLLVPSSLRLLA